MKKFLPLLITAAMIAVVINSAAFAEHHEGDEAGAADPRIGEEVNRICFSSGINRWSAVEGEDGAILLDRAVNDWHLVKITKGCDEKRVKRAGAILLEGKPGSSCLARNDSISLVEYGGVKYNCRIKKINKWNVDGAAPDVGEALEGNEDV